MQFKLNYTFPSLTAPIRFRHSVLSLGSCFAEHMGGKMKAHKFNVLLNPSGILFNPTSILNNLKFYQQVDLFWKGDYIYEHQELFHSHMHHGSFSTPDSESLKQTIASQFTMAEKQFRQMNYLLITWGTAYVYELKSSGEVVANCHKLPQQLFNKRLLEVDEIVREYAIFIEQLRLSHPELKIIFSISPVKYLREGVHENNLSKAVLHLALDKLQKQFSSIYYFPAFELVQDDLRDYRYYAQDLAHPNQLAIEYIWENFVAHCLHPDELQGLKKISALNQALQHRPLHGNTKAYQDFIRQQLVQTQELQKQLSELNFEEELSFLESKLTP